MRVNNKMVISKNGVEYKYAENRKVLIFIDNEESVVNIIFLVGGISEEHKKEILKNETDVFYLVRGKIMATRILVKKENFDYIFSAMGMFKNKILK